MKFGKEFKLQMVPEWQDTYMDYKNMKNVLKDIMKFIHSKKTTTSSGNDSLMRKTSINRAFSGLNRGYSDFLNRDDENLVIQVNYGPQAEIEGYQTNFLKAFDEGGEYELFFFMRLDDELNKVNTFYKTKVEEVINEAESLNKQMDALIALRVTVAKPDHAPDTALQSPITSFSSNAASKSEPIPRNVASTGEGHMDVIEEIEMSSEGITEEPSEDCNGNETRSIINHKQNQHEKLNVTGPRLDPLEILENVKINITLDTPRSTIQGILKGTKYKDLNHNKKDLKEAEEKLKVAFVEFYRKLRLLKGFRFLNILAFSKIMKKYDKITGRSVSRSYLKMVDNSYLGSSEEVSRFMERVEATFIKYFSHSNRGKGMQILRPQKKRERHRITFSLGFFSGTSVALMVALVVIIRAKNIENPNSTQYMENMFPLYSLFGFIVLHMMMYASNIFFWRHYRVNYRFIFGFKQGTELGYREVFLLSTGLATLALTSVISNLDMEMDRKMNGYQLFIEVIPLILVGMVLIITFCPFNIIYRSSRFFLLQCLFHCICAPLYKVTLLDVFLADQLTSQVQAFRGLEFYICYYGWGDLKQRRNSCSKSGIYGAFSFIVAVVPYWMRFLQCARHLCEKKDMMQGYNALKYFSTIVAVVMRTAYIMEGGVGLRIMAAITSAIATIVNTYWDIVLDWGLLQRNSQNPWLRDKLILNNKRVYFVSMVLNVLLRFAWLQTVLKFNVAFMHWNAMIAVIACLEIIRRGIWNFFRLENEHLNNVGKFRAVKSMPLPFNYNEDENEDEDED